MPHTQMGTPMKCRGLPPAVLRPEGAEGSATRGSEGAVETCLLTTAAKLEDEAHVQYQLAKADPRQGYMERDSY